MKPARRTPLLLALVAACVFTLSGCISNPLSGLLVTKGAKEREIAALRADYETKAAAARETQDRAAKALLAAKDAQMVGAAAPLFGIDQVFRSIVTPTRTDLITRNLGAEAWTALGNVPPTAEAMRAMNERLSKELDATRSSLADLQTNHTAALAQNQALADQARVHQAALAAAEAARVKLDTDYRAQLAAKQDELIAVQGEVIAAEKQRGDDRVALQALKVKASTALGIIGLIAIALAIYVPVFRAQCAGFGALCLMASGGLWLIQPWMIGAAVAACVLALIAWMVVTHQRKDRSHDALALTVQDLRDKGGPLAAAVDESLADRSSRYRRAKDGSIVTERDPAVERELHATLAAYDALPAKPAA